MNKQLRGVLRLPLIGLNLMWLSFMIAVYVGLFENSNVYDVAGGYQEVRASTYLFLLGIALLSVFTSLAHTMADKIRLDASGNTDAVRSVFRYASLGVIIALVSGAIFAIANFLGSFNDYQKPTVLGRLLGVYLPIILATVLVVLVLLRATVFRKSSDHERGEGGKMSAQQRALILSFSLPIVGTALAIILGLVFYDAQGRTLDIWTWVVIQAIIGTSVIFGTRFAAAAKVAKPVAKPAAKTVAGAIGAVNLNLVLSIIFGGVVILMAFTSGADAITQLRNWDYIDSMGPSSEVRAITLGWFLEKLLPALVLLELAAVGIYLTMSSRLAIGRKHDA